MGIVQDTHVVQHFDTCKMWYLLSQWRAPIQTSEIQSSLVWGPPKWYPQLGKEHHVLAELNKSGSLRKKASNKTTRMAKGLPQVATTP